MESSGAVRAQVGALGGNALLCHRYFCLLSYRTVFEIFLLLIFRVVQLESGAGASGGVGGARNASRNQIYNMISVTGDAVVVEFTVSPLIGSRSLLKSDDTKETPDI